MFALRHRILGPAGKISLFRSNLAATERTATSLLDWRRTVPSGERRTVCASAVPPPHSLIRGIHDDNNNNNINNSTSLLLLVGAPRFDIVDSILARLVVAMASNWFVGSMVPTHLRNNPWSSSWITNGIHNNNNDDEDDWVFRISTLKRRRKMMNKHKLRKRRKKNRMKNKK